MRKRFVLFNIIKKEYFTGNHYEAIWSDKIVEAKCFHSTDDILALFRDSEEDSSHQLHDEFGDLTHTEIKPVYVSSDFQ